MDDNSIFSDDYQLWLGELKTAFRRAQIKAAVRLNTELITFYWELGEKIIERQKTADWGSKFLERLSRDLSADFPEVKGFSKRNLELIRRWRIFWSDPTIAKQVVSQLSQIPWGHNLLLVSKIENFEEALFYVQKSAEKSWSRNVLSHQIESRLFEREGSAISNFERTLPAEESDLARQSLKDPYIFDFLSLSEVKNERDLEQKLTERISKFLLELGAGFAYVGKQVPLLVGNREFYLDLLFYHTKLHCYVVIELKTGDFEPEHAGKLNFYLKATDEQIKTKEDGPTIGILMCKSKDRLIAEYSLSDINKPMGISEYRLTNSLPEILKNSLPSVDELRKNLE